MQNMIEISSKTPFDSRISTPRLLSSLSQTIPPSLVALAYNSFFDKIAFPAPSLAPPVPSELHLEADVVIIGSGAGAGVVASRVAKQGRRVIVLEKGPYVSQVRHVLILSLIIYCLNSIRSTIDHEDDCIDCENHRGMTMKQYPDKVHS